MGKTLSILILLLAMAAMLLSGCIVVGDNNATGINNDTGSRSTVNTETEPEQKSKIIHDIYGVLAGAFLMFVLFLFGAIEVAR